MLTKKEKLDEGDVAIHANALMNMVLNKFNQLKWNKT
jgi:hypothetical protein